MRGNARDLDRHRIHPRLSDRLWLWLSRARHFDGLWVGSFGGPKSEDERALDRVEQALALIKSRDRVRYLRLIRDIDRVWIVPQPEAIGSYNRRLGACQLASRFVLAETTSAELIAATIVHEATHARLMSCGIGYGESLRQRVEAVCVRRELAFARKLLDPASVTSKAKRSLEYIADGAYLQDAALAQRHENAYVDALRREGVPLWFIRGSIAVRQGLLWIRRRR